MDKLGLSVKASERGSEVVLPGRLGEMSLVMQVLTLAIWPLLEQVLAFFVGITDIFIAGWMSKGVERIAIMDAMALGGFVAWFLFIFQGAVATGVLALVSRATGARDPKLASLGLGQGVWLGALAGFAAFLVLQAGLTFLIKWMGLSPAAAVFAEEYIRVLAWSGPIAGATFAVNAALRGYGDTMTPFLTMVVVNVVNFATSILFVFGPEPIGGMGVKGIALGTVVGWVAGLVTVVTILAFRKSEGLRWRREELMFHFDTIVRIWRVGLPQAIEVAGMWLIHSYALRVISNLNQEGALGAHVMALRLEAMSFLPGFAIATAAAALTGQYLGAGSKEMAKQAVRFSWKLAVGVMLSMGIFFILAREFLVGLLAPGSELHLQLVSPLLVVCALTQPFFATCILVKTTMRGAGATRLVMSWAFSSMLFYRVGVLWVLSTFDMINLTGVWIVLSLDLFTQSIIFSRLHFKGRWLDAKV